MLKDNRNIVDEMRGLDIDRIRLLREQNSLPFAVAVNNITGGLNLGTILRSCNFLGAREVFYWGRKHYDARSTVGTHKYSSIEYLDSLDQIKNRMNGYMVVGLENNRLNTIPMKEANYAKKTCFVFGEEGTGLNEEILELCDMIVTVPGRGTVRSLNVSACAAIVMQDYVNKNYGA